MGFRVSTIVSLLCHLRQVTLGRSPYLSEPVLRLRIEALTAPEAGRIQ